MTSVNVNPQPLLAPLQVQAPNLTCRYGSYRTASYMTTRSVVFHDHFELLPPPPPPGATGTVAAIAGAEVGATFSTRSFSCIPPYA